MQELTLTKSLGQERKIGHKVQKKSPCPRRDPKKSIAEDARQQTAMREIRNYPPLVLPTI